MSKIQKAVQVYLRAIWDTIRWLGRKPFQNLPPDLSAVPPELQVFEAQADEIQHHAVGEIPLPHSHGHTKSKPSH